MFKVQPKLQTNQQATQILSSSYKPGQTLLYCRSNNGQLTTVHLNPNNQIIVRQCSINGATQVTAEFEHISKNSIRIKYAFIDGNDAFIINQLPLQIYFLSQDSKIPIKLQLRDSIIFKNCVMQVNYPTAIIFGIRQKSTKNQMLQLNFQTLQIKIVNDGKGYAPKANSQFVSLILDGRIYVFGGKDQKGKNCDQVIWVYDIEKGYWFALQMKYPVDQNFNNYQIIPISNSKVMLISKTNGKNWVLQVHQSRLTQINGEVDYKQNTVCIKDQLSSFQKDGWVIWKKKIAYHKN